jgi:multiple sugar transport system permease protein
VKTQFRVAVVNREPVREQARSLRRRRYGEAGTAWSYVLPSVVIILGLGIVPMVWS